MGFHRVVEWIGSITGLLGSWLIATNTDVSGWAFPAWLISNACWIAFSIRTKNHPMLLMQIGYTASSILGVYRWL